MPMQRKVQRSILRLNMKMSNIPINENRTTNEIQVVYEDYNSIMEHWLRYCPTMGYWPKVMTARLTEPKAHLDDKETTIAILNSQNAVAYKEIT